MKTDIYKKKKFLIIASDSISLIKFRFDFILALVKNGYKVEAICGKDNNFFKVKKNLNKIGVKLESYLISKNSISIFDNLKTYRDIKLFIFKLKPDIIFSYTVKPVVFSGIVIKNLSNIKFFPLITGLGYAFTSFKFFKSFKRSFVKLILIYLYKKAFSQATSILFQNSEDKKLFMKLKLIKKKTPVFITNGSGVNLKQFKRTLYPKKPVFLMISRLLVDKGIREYVEAAYEVKKKYPKARFVLVGSLDSNPSSIDFNLIKSKKFKSAIEHYRWHDDIRPFLKSCKFFILPSYREGTPRSTLEALAFGRPIITTNVPGCKETVINGRNGYMIKPRDVGALQNAMIKLINTNDKDIKKMSEESFILAKKKFDVKKVNKYIIEILNRYQ